MNLLRLLVRIDARRAAAWLAFVAGLGAGAILPAAPAGRPALEGAWLVGACLAMAAIGAPLLSPAAPLAGVEAPAALRAAWPALGILVGAAAALVAGAGPRAATTTLLLLAGALAATRVRVGATRRGASDADAISLALALAGAAALASWGILPAGTRGGLRAGAIVAAFAALLAAIVALDAAGERLAAARVGGVTRGGMLPPASPLRRVLVTSSMLVAIGGMVAWLFLLPGRAATDACVTLAAFVAVAVPAALVPDGRLDPAWRGLLASVPPRFAPRRSGGTARPGSTVWLDAAILGWPPLVAGLLLVRDAPAGLAAAAVAAVTAAAAAATALLGARAIPLGTPETRLAVALVGAAAIGLATLLRA